MSTGLGFRLETSGYNITAAKLGRMAQAVINTSKRNQAREAKAIIALAKVKFVPVELGDLMNSGFVGNTFRRGNKITTILGFGGGGVNYAVAIHENPSSSTPPSWVGKKVHFKKAGTGPKYLEKAARTRIRGMTNRLGKDLDLAMRRA